MGVAVAVAEDQLRLSGELFQRLQQGWHLAKGKQPRDVGKRRRALDQHLIGHDQRGIVHHHRCRPNHPPAIGEGSVDASNLPDRTAPAGTEAV